MTPIISLADYRAAKAMAHIRAQALPLQRVEGMEEMAESLEDATPPPTPPAATGP